jgi:hypothetical protein
MKLDLALLGWAREAASWCGRVQYQHWIAALAVLLVMFDTFVNPISGVSIGLLIVAVAVLSPWWRQVPTFLKSAELPGGLKLEFRHELNSATQEVQQAGLFSEPQPEKKGQPIYEIIYNDDPTLSLAGLRIAIERRLRDLAKIAGISQAAPLTRLATNLEAAQVLTHEQASALHDLLPLLNKALHSEEYSKEAADWAITFGPKLVAGLDERAVAAGARPEQLWGSSVVSIAKAGSRVEHEEAGR